MSAPPGTGSAPSLLGRVFLRVSLTMFAAILLVVTVLYVEFRGHIDTMRDRSLSGQASDVARHLVTNGEGGVRIDLPPALAAAYGAGSDRYRYAVLDASGRLLASSPGVSETLDPEGPVTSGPSRYFERLDEGTGQRYYGASIVHPASIGPLSIQVQQSADHDDVIMDTFLDELGDEVMWIVVLVFAAILLVTYWTLRASLASLGEISREAAAIGPETLDRRLGMQGVPAEALPMVQAINAALDRVEGAFRLQRRFTADAAHEMRTPIAVLRAHLDALGTGNAEALRRDLTALDRVVGQLLKLAQVDSLSLEPGTTADLHAVAINVVALMAPGAIAAGRRIAVSGDERCTVPGDPDAIEVAVRNLVENAINHAPPGSEVEISVDAAHRRLCVLDRGPGVDPADRERVFERFWRRERGDGRGAGLGLSIVSRIATAHGASVHVDERAGGGASFCITFPA